MQYHIGDKVRFIHQKQEGVVIKLKDKGIVVVSIENGFDIPVASTELTLIAREENLAFKTGTPKDAEKPKPRTESQAAPVLASKGLYLAAVAEVDGYALFLINNSDLNIPLTVGMVRAEKYTGLLTDLLGKRSFRRIDNLTQRDLTQPPTLLVHALPHQLGPQEMPKPLAVQYKLIPLLLKESLEQLPLLPNKGFLLQLDQAENPAKGLVTLHSPKPATNHKPAEKLEKPRSTIDLHIEKLVEKPQLLSPSLAFEKQKEVATEVLSRAIATNMEQIMLIHGIGNGRLKVWLWNHLNTLPEVKEYRIAPPNQGGAGATEIFFM